MTDSRSPGNRNKPNIYGLKVKLLWVVLTHRPYPKKYRPDKAVQFNKKAKPIMTHSDTITKKRYTLREVQALATSTYGLLVQPITTKNSPYGIYFEGQLVWQCNKLTEVVECLPKLYTSIQEQLAEQTKTATPMVQEVAASDENTTEDNTLQIGTTYTTGDLTIRCTQVGGTHAATWTVYDGSRYIGDIKMGWDCLWNGKFTTPQEATAELMERTPTMV